MRRALFLAALAASFAQFGAVTSLNDVARYFGHVSHAGSLQAQVGLSGSVLGVGLAVLRLASLFALPLAALGDRFGRTRVLRLSFVVGLLATALASASASYWMFVACFALARPLLSASSALVQILTVELSTTVKRLGALVIMSAGAGIGAGLSAVVHGLVRHHGSFRLLFLLALVPVLCVTPLLRHVPETTVDDDHAAPLATLGRVSVGARPKLWSLATVTFALGMITGPANGFAFVYGEGVLKISPQFVAAVVTSSALTGLLGLVLSRRLGNSWGRKRTVTLGLVASALTSCLAYSGGETRFTIGYLCGVGAAAVLAPALSALGTESFARVERATAGGWLVVAGVGGATAGVVLFGYVGDAVHASGPNALRLAALVTFLPLLPTLALLRFVPETHRGELA